MLSHQQEGISDQGHGNSELFTIRLWMEEVGEEVDYRGQVKHVVSGATRHFRKWDDLEAFLLGAFDDNEKGETWRSRH